MERNRKIALVGYTAHKRFAPWRDSSWDIAGLNDAYRQPEWQDVLGDDLHKHRVHWFQLHHQDQDGSFRHGANDPVHLEQLATLGVAVWMWREHPKIPTGRIYPYQDIMALFPRGYFNNSISWMIAWAINEGYEEIAIYGVDMALDGVTNAEYAHQRPSCEYFIGIAEGRGIKVTLPEECDLLQSAFQYGRDDISPVRQKLMQRHAELVQREAQLRESVRIGQINLASTEGARQDVEYFLRAWFPDDGVVGVAELQPPVSISRDELLTGLPSGVGVAGDAPVPDMHVGSAGGKDMAHG